MPDPQTQTVIFDGKPNVFPADFTPYEISAALAGTRLQTSQDVDAIKKKLEDNASYVNQVSAAKLKHDAEQAIVGAYHGAKAIAYQALTDPLGLSQPASVQARDEQFQRGSATPPSSPASASDGLGRIGAFLHHPIDTTVDALQAAGVTPESFAQGAGATSLAAAAPALVHGTVQAGPTVGRGLTATGDTIQTVAEMPGYAKGAKAVGTLAGTALGTKVLPGVGSTAGAATGFVAGEAIPAATGAVGRLVSRAGDLVAGTRVPAGEIDAATTLLTEAGMKDAAAGTQVRAWKRQGVTDLPRAAEFYIQQNLTPEPKRWTVALPTRTPTPAATPNPRWTVTLPTPTPTPTSAATPTKVVAPPPLRWPPGQEPVSNTVGDFAPGAGTSPATPAAAAPAAAPRATGSALAAKVNTATNLLVDAGMAPGRATKTVTAWLRNGTTDLVGAAKFYVGQFLKD
jgi:hypothetical protein